MKDLSTCALALALVASVCSLHEDSWKLKVKNLVTLACIMFPRACASFVHCVPKTVGGVTKISSCEASGKVWEPLIELWVCAPRSL